MSFIVVGGVSGFTDIFSNQSHWMSFTSSQLELVSEDLAVAGAQETQHKLNRRLKQENSRITILTSN